MSKFVGMRFPLVKDPRGYMSAQDGVNQIKSDLISLLLTDNYERIMLTDFGASLNELLFEPNTDSIIEAARTRIANAINSFEPRITVESIIITTDVGGPGQGVLDDNDDGAQEGQILYINIRFFDPENITDVQELRLELPLGGV